MRSVKYIEQLRETLTRKSDQEVADKLGISRAAVNHYKTGFRVMDDETCLALALQLNIDPMEIIGAACMDRAEKSGQKSLWEVFMSRTAAAAATVLMASGVTIFLTPGNAEAASMRVPGPAIATSIDYAKLRRRRCWWRLRTKLASLERMPLHTALEPTAS